MQFLRAATVLAILALVGAFELPPIIPSNMTIPGFLSVRLWAEDLRVTLGTAALVPSNVHTQQANNELGIGLVLTGSEPHVTKFNLRQLTTQSNHTRFDSWGFVSLELSYFESKSNVTHDLCVSFNAEDERVGIRQPIMLLDCFPTRLSSTFTTSQQFVIDFKSDTLGIVLPNLRPPRAITNVDQRVGGDGSQFEIAAFSWMHIGDMNDLLVNEELMNTPGLLHTAFISDSESEEQAISTLYTKQYLQEQWDGLVVGHTAKEDLLIY